MPDCTQPADVFDRYLRLSTSLPAEWLAAVRLLSGSPALNFCTSAAPGFHGSLSWLDTQAGTLAGMMVNRNARLAELRPDRASLLTVLDGVVELTVDASATPLSVGPGQARYLPSGASFEANVIGPCRALVALFPGSMDQGFGQSSGMAVSADLAAGLQACLDRSGFWQDHDQASREVAATLDRVRGALAGEAPLWPGCDQTPGPGVDAVDRRVAKALDWLLHQTGTGFDLAQLASTAGLSTRNLYYLMHRHTGLTPYRFFQSVRLLRVRKALLNCPSDTPTVSWHALTEGFGHLGRFSALYLRQFGEYPSDTLRWRETMARQRALVSGLSGCEHDLCLGIRAPERSPVTVKDDQL